MKNDLKDLEEGIRNYWEMETMRPWVIYFGVVATICLAYPPMLGFCMGLLACYLLQWLIYKAIGG